MIDPSELIAAAVQNPTPLITEANPAPVAAQKQASVSLASDEKKAAMGAAPQLSPADSYKFAIGRATGAGGGSMSPLEQELATSSERDILDKYGPDQGGRLIRQQLSGINAYQQDTSAQRTEEGAAADFVSSIGMGLGNSVGGIAALTMGAINGEAGVTLSRGLDFLNQQVQGSQTAALQSRRRANAGLNELMQRDTAAQRKVDDGKYGTILSGLKRIGTDAIDSVGNAVSDPMVLSDGVAQGLGSLVAAGPVGKGVSKLADLGRAVLPEAAKKSATLGAVGSMLPNSVTVGIGAMEAGGAFTQTANEIYKMSFEDLEKGSEEYRKLTEDGMSPDKARMEVAAMAARRAAAITAPFAVAAGKLVSKFEGNPLAAGSLRNSAGNMIREAVEEGAQGFTGQFAQNAAVKGYANSELDMTEGVGEQVGTGALYGMGTAGAIQAPNIARRAAIDSVRAAGTLTLGALQGAEKDIAKRADAVQAANDKASPVSPDVVQEAATQAVANAPEAQATMREAVEAVPNATPEAKAAGTQYVDNLVSSIQLDQADIDSLPPNLQAVVQGSTNRFDAMHRLSEVISGARTTEEPEQDKQYSALILYSMQDQLDKIILSDPEVLQSLPKDSPALAVVSDYGRILASMKTTPSVKNALAQAKEMILASQQAQAEQVPNEDTLATPEGQQAAETAVAAAIIRPDLANRETNDAILMHASQGRIRLTQDQHAALQLSNTVLTAAKKASDAQAALGHKKKLSQVSDMIQTGTEPNGGKVSALTHSDAVFSAVRAGNIPLATSNLNNFGKFVQHMQNKVDALNKSFEKGGTQINYRALNSETREWYDRVEKLQVRPETEGGVELAQTIQLEAERLADIYNGLRNAFPALNAPEITATPLDISLQGPIKDVAAAFKSGARIRPGSVAATSPTTVVKTPAPAPVAPAKVPGVVGKITPKADLAQAAIDDAEERIAIQSEPLLPVVETKSVESQISKETIDKPSEPTKEEAPAAPLPKGIDAVYENLFGSDNDRNFFKKAYKFAKSQKSRLTTMSQESDSSPIEGLRKTVASGENLADLTGDRSWVGIGRDVSRAYKQYLDEGTNFSKILDKRLEKFLNSDKKIAERFRKGEEANRWSAGKALNITEDRDGKLVYNQELKEAAVLAGLQWLLTATQSETKLDEKAVASILGMAEEDVDEDIMSQMNQGLPLLVAKRGLAQKIKQFWGLQDNPDAPAGYVEGIPEAMAAELLETMVAADALERINLSFEVQSQDEESEDGSVTYSPRTPAVFKPAFKLEADHPLTKEPSLIEKALMIDPEEVTYFGAPPKKVEAKQLRNALVDNTPEQKALLKHAQDTPHYINRPMVDFYNTIGKPNFMRLLGEGDLSDKAWNQNHFKSLEGMNRTVEGGFDQLMNTVAQLEEASSRLGSKPEETPIHYAYNITRVGRLMMMGRYNPQSTKSVREAILPTWSTLDLSNQTGPDYRKFALGLAQALDVKVHKKTLDSSINEVMGYLNDEMADAISDLREFHTSGKGPNSLTDSILAGFKAIGKPVTAIGLHALVEYARYLTTKDQANFKTAMYVEADGVTNGAINAMALLSSGEFTPNWVNRMKKGGLTFTGSKGGPRTMNDIQTFGSERGGDDRDMYQTTTDNLDRILKDLRKEPKSPQAADQMNMLRDLMNEFMPDYIVTPDGLELKRGIAKNPLTITLYGSGEKGIAGKVVRSMLDDMYERMSDAAQRQKQNPKLSNAEALFGGVSTDGKSANERFTRFATALKTLTNDVVARTKENKLYTKRGDKTSPIPDLDFQKFTLNGIHKKNLSQNVLHMFVKPLRTAITETVGADLMQSATLLRQATQVQSLLQQDMFTKLVEAELESSSATNPRARTEGLSQNQQKKILDAVIAKHPLIDTGTQVFFPAGSQSTNMNTTSYGNSLSDTLRTDGFMYGPQNSRVAGIPFMVIGTGDGQAIQSLGTSANPPQGALYIYDGVNFKLTTLEEDSIKANKAIYDSWQGNPMEAVFKSLKVSLKDFDSMKLSPATIREITKSVQEKGDEGSVPLSRRLKSLLDSVENASISIEARHRVMSKTEHAIDQMAAAASPYEHKGLTVSGNTDEEIAAELTDLYYKELKSLKKERGIEEAPVAEALPADVGTKDATGVRILSPDYLQTSDLEKHLSPEQKDLYRQIRKHPQVKDFTIVLGTKEQHTAYAQEKGLTNRMTEGNFNGLIDLNSKHILLLRGSPETFLHEMIHAATSGVLISHYEGKTNPQVTDAVNRLESLVGDFITGSNKTDDAYGFAASTVASLMNNGKKAEAIDEMIAWTLSNKEIGTKTKTVNTSLPSRVVKAVITAVKDLIFGKRSSAIDDKLFSNVEFNARVLMGAAASIDPTNGVRFQNAQYGQSQRLTDIQSTFENRIAAYLRDDNVGSAISKDLKAMTAIRVNAAAVSNSVIAHGFPMNPQELTTFHSVVSALATEALIDPNSMTMAQDLYNRVTKVMKVEDFMTNTGDPDADRYYAQERYDTLMGNYTVATDEQGRSSLLPAFLGLAMVNEPFRQVLAKMPLPKTVLEGWNTLDGVLQNAGTIAMESLADRMAGVNGTKNVQGAVDALTRRIQEVASERQTLIDQVSAPVGSMVDKANDFVVNAVQALASKAVKGAEKLNAKVDNNGTKLLASAARITEAVVNKDKANDVAESAISLLNRMDGFRPIHELVNDIIGRTEGNKNVYDLIKTSKSVVQQDRQQYREKLPSIIDQKFKTKLTDTQWTQLYRMAKTDIAGLVTGPNGVNQVLKLINNKTEIAKTIGSLEDTLRKADSTYFNLTQKKARQLANYMLTGKQGTNLLRNSNAIASLLNERVSANRRVPGGDYTQAIDQLVSLYALDNLGNDEKEALASLVQDEAEGMEFTVSYLVGQRADEVRKANTGRARFNHYKGYIPSLNGEGVSLIVADDSRFSELAEMSYVRVGNYDGSPAERLMGSKGYYFAPVSAKAPYSQGILQNVHQTASGVNASTGFTEGLTAGRIADEASVERITKSLRYENSSTKENLMPVFNADGEVVAYERGVDPEQLHRLNRNTHLAKMIGVWRGRQVEEATAQVFNDRLIDALHDMYTNDMSISSGRKVEYVDLFGKLDDKVLADAVSLMTSATKNKIASTFADGKFLVRKDMLNDALGYRNASVGDSWTGISRLSERTQNNIKNLAITAFGNDAYRFAVAREKNIQNFVSDARVMIVVKSVVVPVMNLVSNMVQLLARGVPLAQLMRSAPKKISEVHSYTNSRVRQIEAEVELRAATDVRDRRRLETEIQTIKDGHKRLSIWPLIKAGEFTAISDTGISRDEILLSEGRLHAYMETLVDKLPGPAGTLAKYALVTKDTALFQGLQKTVEYGDFIAKAIFYDDLIQRKKLSPEVALGRVTEEFVNYDRLPGRFRGTMESLGLLWFYHFKIRAAKVALSMIRENPVHSMLAMSIPHAIGMNSIGTPITDNLFYKGATDALGPSIGPGMGFNGLTLNPWWNLTH